MATQGLMCTECGKTFIPQKFHPYQKFCSKRCRWRYRDKVKRGKAYYQKARFEALEVLGSKCAACGVDDYRLLTIDHKDGNSFFKKRNKRLLYEAIVKNPEKAKKHLQVLCWNHNSMKYFYSGEIVNRTSPCVTMVINPQGS